MLTWRHHQILWHWFVSLVTFSYWSKFHLNIITGSGVMAIYFYWGLTRNPEIGNTPVWVLPNIWRLGWVRDTTFDKDVSNKMLLHAAKYHGYSFYRFWVVKGKTGGKSTPHQNKVKIKLKSRILINKTYLIRHNICQKLSINFPKQSNILLSNSVLTRRY